MKKVLTISLLALTILAMLAACSSSSTLTGGKWVMDSATVGGETVSMSEYAELLGNMSFSFNIDNTCNVSAYGVEGTGTYTQNGSDITLSSDDTGMDLTLKYDGGKLTIEQDGVIINFKKS